MTERDVAERVIDRLTRRGWTWRRATGAVLAALDVVGEPDVERIELVATGALVGATR